jgi:hypothetical protein
MKIWKIAIRIWFTLASLASFLTGWVVLVHSPKPNQFNIADIPAMPQLDPVPTLKQVMFSDESPNFVRPNRRALVLRSGGS